MEDVKLKRYGNSKEIKRLSYEDLNKDKPEYVARIWKDEVTIWYSDNFMNLSRSQVENILKIMNKLKKQKLKNKK